MKTIPIDQRYTQDILFRLLNTPSPSGYTDRAVHLVADELDKLGVPVELTRRGAIMILMSVELMLNAANLAFITFSRLHDQPDGQIFAFFIMTLAAAEAAGDLGVGVHLHVAEDRIDQVRRHAVHANQLALLVIGSVEPTFFV